MGRDSPAQVARRPRAGRPRAGRRPACPTSSCAPGGLRGGARRREIVAGRRRLSHRRSRRLRSSPFSRNRRFALRRRRRPSCCRCRAARSGRIRRRPSPAGVPGLDRLLRMAAARGASILYLSSDARPSVRVDGEIQMLEGEPSLGPNDVESLLLTLMPERNHEALRSGLATEWISDVEGRRPRAVHELPRSSRTGRRVPDHARPRGIGRAARSLARGAVARDRARRAGARLRVPPER